MPPTIGTIRTRIRTQLNEATQRFWPDSALSGLIDWYSDGAAQQHRIALSMARDQSRFGELDHPYLRRFAKSLSINVVEGTQLYVLPPDVLELWEVGIANAAGQNEQRASRYDPDNDWMSLNLPHLQPTFDRPAWSLQIDPADGIVKLQVIVFGNLTVPNAPLVARLYYFREIGRVQDLNPNAAVDLDDPYNEGPVWYACGEADVKRGGDGSPYFQFADQAARNIFAPAASAAATTNRAQAKATAGQEEALVTRDAR